MLTSAVKAACAVGLTVALSGCASSGSRHAMAARCGPRDACAGAPGDLAAALPPNAKPGECYVKQYVPPQYRTVKERVLVREASEQVEVVPARYEWVEERICVKDGAKELEVAPAEFATREQTLQVQPPRTDWEVNTNARCAAATNEPAKDVYCLVKRPGVQKTIQTQCMVAPPRVREVSVPAEYQTVRRQKLVCPATTRTVHIPAQYTEIEKTVKVCDARMVWKRINCDEGEVSMRIPQPASPVTAKAKVAQSSQR